MADQDIAIIGMAGRFPGARSVAELWDLLASGREAIRQFTPEELAAAGVDAATLADPDFVNAGAPLEDAGGFDAAFFGYTPREAEIMDPQQRIFLESCWHALEDAGYAPDKYAGLISVFGGVARNTYFLHNAQAFVDLHDSGAVYEVALGTDKDYVATRVAYKLNLRGASFSVQSACSSSAVATHLAIQALLSGDCDIALAGGARVHVPQTGGYKWVEGGIPSRDGHCRAFDADATGCVYGSGAAVIVLKRLADALEDGDSIYAVIRATAINNDGSQKVGFTAPSLQGQREVVETALSLAEVDPETIGYVEAHGTGTRIGDPIEISALTQAYRRYTRKTGYCAIGSLKTNIGHLDAGAGVAGIIKAALMLRHGKLVPSLNFKRPNPEIDFERSPFFVIDELRDWPQGETPRRAAVSAFGLGGTNFHAILEQAPEPPRAHAPREVGAGGDSRREGASRGDTPGEDVLPVVLPISAASAESLARTRERLASFSAGADAEALRDMAYTLQVGRADLAFRQVFAARSADEWIAALRAAGRPTKADVGLDRACFMFPGQGTQYPNMARRVYAACEVFRDQVDRSSEILAPILGQDLRDLVFVDSDCAFAGRALAQTRIAQPALFVIEHALAMQWMHWGIQPEAFVGHSLGEYVAACLAGVFDLEDALATVAKRGALMQEMPEGSMLAVAMPEEALRAELVEPLEIATLNAPALCVVGGDTERVNRFAAELAAKGIDASLLETSHAFHTRMMDGMLEDFRAHLESIELHAPAIPFASNVTGTWITAEQATDPGYWVDHIRRPVRFAECIGTLTGEGPCVLLEVGPGSVLSGLARQCLSEARPIVSSLPRPSEDLDDLVYLMGRFGQLWAHGYPVDWSRVYAPRRRVHLPGYSFEHKTYWLERRGRKAVGAPAPAEGLEGHGPAVACEAQGSAAARDAQGPAHVRAHGDLRAEQGSAAREVPATAATGDHDGCALPELRKDAIERRLKALLSEQSGLDGEAIDAETSFVELGFDSLFLMRAATAFRKAFGVEIGFIRLLEDTPSVAKLAEWLDRTLPAEDGAGAAARTPAAAPSATAASEAAPPAPVRAATPGAAPAPVRPQPGALPQDAASLAALVKRLAGEVDALRAQLAALERGAAPSVEPPAGAATAPRTMRSSSDAAPAIAPTTARTVAPATSPAAAPTRPSHGARIELTDAQREILVAILFDEESNRAFNITSAISFLGPLAPDALRAAAERLVADNPILSSRVERDSSALVHIAEPRLVFEVETVRDEDLEAVQRREASEPFDIWRGPLVRFRLLRLGDDRSVLLTTVHHIVADGWSIGKMHQALGAYYRGQPAGAETLPTQFAEYSARQRANTAALDRAVLYWKQELAGYEDTFELPADRPRPRERTYAADCEALRLDLEFCDALRKHGAAHGCTLYTTLVAGYFMLLARLTRATDLVVGITAAGQFFADMPDVVGHCVNTLPLRVGLSETTTVNELLREMRVKTSGALDHYECTYGRLLQEISIARDPGRPTLISTVFNFNPAGIAPDFGDVAVQARFAPRTYEIYDSFFNVTEDAGGLSLQLVMNSALFDAATVRRHLWLYRQCLRQILENGDAAVFSSDLMDAAGRAELARLSRGADLAVAANGFVDLFERTCAAVAPDAVAIQSGGRRLTYGDIAEQSSRLAAYLKQRGIRARDIVGIHLTRGADLVVAMIAIWKAGAAYLPLDPEFPPERLKYMVENAAVATIISESARNASPLGAPSNVLIDAERSDWMSAPPVETATAVEGSDPAYVLYTSGSTGRPKGVVVPHGAVANFLESMKTEPGLRPDDRLLAVTTVSFDISVLELFLPLVVGGCAVVAASDEAADGAALLRLIDAEGITVMQATPSTWRLLIEAGWKGHSRFKALCGGEAFPLDLRAAMLERCAEVWNLYGPTETTVWSACGRLRPEGRITVGKPIANTDIFVLDDAGQALPPGLPGEVWIGGAGVSLGYLKRPDLTAERFKPYPGEPEGGRRMYRTGDLGRWTNDGELEVLGRVDHQVKIRGFRIELPEIEARLAAHPEIRNAVVTVWDAEPDDRRLVAYIATSDAEGLSGIALRKYLRASLPEYMIPQHFVPLPELPLTPNGKVDRKALPPPAVAPAAAVAAPSDAERPSTPMEILIAGIWKEIVGRDEVLRNDNFFDLGGHSLLAVRVISRIEQATGWRPSPRLLILENLRELAAHCERAVARPPVRRSFFSKLRGLVGSAE